MRVWRVVGAAEADPAAAADMAAAPDDAESHGSISPAFSDAGSPFDTRPGTAAGMGPVPPGSDPLPGYMSETNLFERQPFREYRGHQGDVFDIAWSTVRPSVLFAVLLLCGLRFLCCFLGFRRIAFCSFPYLSVSSHLIRIVCLLFCDTQSNFILTASMDMTVRLWHLKRRECLCVFPHVDFVTAVDFHPLDERFFLSGSFDEKIRIWAIPENKGLSLSFHDQKILARPRSSLTEHLVSCWKSECFDASFC